MSTPVINKVNNNNDKDVILDLQHHPICSRSLQQMVGRMTREATVSDLLKSLGGAASLEIRFSGCDDPLKNGC